jgi:hypothetical protein
MGARQFVACSLNKKAETHFYASAFQEKLAATYSRGVYETIWKV